MPLIKNCEISLKNWKILATIGWAEDWWWSFCLPQSPQVPSPWHCLAPVDMWVGDISHLHGQRSPMPVPALPVSLTPRIPPIPLRTGFWAPAFSPKLLLHPSNPQSCYGMLGAMWDWEVGVSGETGSSHFNQPQYSGVTPTWTLGWRRKESLTHRQLPSS